MIKIAIDVNRAVELVNTIPMLVFINDIVEMLIADPDPNNISQIINNTFFYLNFFSSYNIHYQLYVSLIYFHNHNFQIYITNR